MPIRICQIRTETLRQGGNAQQMRVTQAAIEIANQPGFSAQAEMRVTQIAIEFPFTSTTPPPTPSTPPTPTQGNTPPAECSLPPTSECVTTPALISTDESCEALGS